MGDTVADRLGLPARGSVGATLLAGSPPPISHGIERLARARGARAKTSILVRKLVPPPGFMRRWHPLASRGRAGLLLAYLYRPLWMLRHTPKALQAWRAARRAASRD
jgi:hypothetical protein